MDSVRWLREYDPRADEHLKARGDTSVLVGYLRQCADELESARSNATGASLGRDNRIVTPAELEWLRIALDGAGKALPVLFTMLTKAGLREGAMVADEINANVVTANRELARILKRVSSEDSAR